MSIFLQFLGASVLLVLATFALLLAWVFRISRSLGDSPFTWCIPPAVIGLQVEKKDEPDEWPQGRHNELCMGGFERLVLFTSVDAPCLRFAVYTHPEGWLGVIGQTDDTGCWTDLYAIDSSGTLSVVSGTYRAWDFRAIPGTRKVHVPGGTLEELKSAAVAANISPTSQEWDVVALRRTFERAYCENQTMLLAEQPDRVQAMIWCRELQDRLDLEEDMEPDQSHVDELLRALQKQRGSHYRLLCVEECLDKGLIDQRTWLLARSRITVVHDLDDPRTFGYFSPYIGIGKKLRRRLARAVQRQPGRMRAAFRCLNRELPTHKRYQHLACCDVPVPADIYLSPPDKGSST